MGYQRLVIELQCEAVATLATDEAWEHVAANPSYDEWWATYADEMELRLKQRRRISEWAVETFGYILH